MFAYFVKFLNSTLSYPNTIDVKKIKNWRVESRHWCHQIGLDSQNPDHHTQQNEPFSQEMHLKIPLPSLGLKLSNSKPRFYSLSSSLHCEIDSTNCFLTPSSFRSVFYSASYSWINPYFTGGKRIRV